MARFELKAIAGIDHSVEEIEVLEWYKKPGDSITQGEKIILLDVIKTQIEYMSPVSGVLLEQSLKKGQKGHRGVLLCIIETDGGAYKQEIQKKKDEEIEKPISVETERKEEKKTVDTSEKKKNSLEAPMNDRNKIPEDPSCHKTPLARIAMENLRGSIKKRACTTPFVRIADVEREFSISTLKEHDTTFCHFAITDKALALLREYSIDPACIQPERIKGIITEKDVYEKIAEMQRREKVAVPEEEKKLPPQEKSKLAVGAEKFQHAWKIKANALAKSVLAVPSAEGKMKIALRFALEKIKSENAKKEQNDAPFGIIHVVSYAAVYLLKLPQFSYLNNYVHKEGDEYYEVPNETIGLGISIARPHKQGGLIVSVIPHAGRLSFREMASEINERVKRSSMPPLSDFKGLTFTVNNTGSPVKLEIGPQGRYKPRTDTGPHGDLTGHSIIPWAVMEDHSTSTILSFGAFDKNDEMKFAIFSLPFDHRLIDGRNNEGERLGDIEFLAGLKILLESEEFLADIFDGIA